MKIVILDAHVTNPGDLSWEALYALGEVTIFDRTQPEELLERAQGADALLTNKVMIRATDIQALPQLKYIGVMATGYNVVDVTAACERGITVTNVPAYSTHSVAQLVFAHILNIASRVGCHSTLVREGEWSRCSDFSFTATPLLELHNKTIGIIGLGNTGTATARIAIGFGMKVAAYTRKSNLQLIPEIKKMELQELLQGSDIISLNCPLTEETKDMINKQSLALMKPNSILINTGRGGLINEQDLANALNEERIYAAGLDVLSCEPPHSDHPLLKARNCFITPHIAWASQAARKRLIDTIAGNLHSFLEGNPVNKIVI